MKKNLLLLLSSFIIFSSCGKDEIEKKDEVSNAICLPTEINYDNNNFTTKFTYNGKNQIIREDLIDNNTNIGYNTYEYNNDKPIKRNSFNPNNALESVHNYEYNSANQLVKEIYFTYRNGNAIPDGYVTHEYSSEKELKKSSYYYNNVFNVYTTYQYTNGLMIRILSFNPDGTPSRQREIEYDNKKGVASALTNSLAIIGELGFPHQNNITKYIVKGANGQIVNDESETSTYEYGSNGYPEKRNISRMDGVERAETYQYNCKE